jgi:chloramphenicol-sensitive protein RarD
MRAALASLRITLTIGFAALMISVNWFLFIFAVQVGRVTETSLGYYIFPLVAVLFGVVLFGEKLTKLQWLAVGLATLGVVQLTVGLGAAPWISLVLAVTFGLYGLVKKRLKVNPVVSVTAEVLLLAPLFAGWLIWLHGQGEGVFGRDLGTSALLAFSGLITALPLILFSFAAQRVEMATVGLLQYLNPSLQFLCAAVLFGEVLTIYHGIAFALIWTALAIYSHQAIKRGRVPPLPVKPI